MQKLIMNSLKFLLLFPLCLMLLSCGGLPKPGDARTMEEGRGFSLKKSLGGSKTNSEFSTSNP